jgi:NADH-dependent peroxiredoxin subunit F
VTPNPPRASRLPRRIVDRYDLGETTMLDEAILEQLRTHFSNLQADITLALRPSQHEKQAELRAMLESLAATSPRIHLVEGGSEPTPGEATSVRFDILKNGAPTGIRFRAVPGGHEFTSLVLAILNTDGKGRLPDEGIRKRIRALRGPIDLRTYVSLSCTNCPDVVQSLNLMALLHGDFRHETVDGELAEEEVRRYGIQGVPSVVAGDRLLHVGKATLAELLDALEDRFGIGEAADRAELSSEERNYDVVVIGGGPAGASAAIYCARKGLRTAVVAQRFGGQVTETMGIENLVSVVHTEGPRLAADLEKHMRSYSIELLEHRKVDALELGTKKAIRIKGGETLTADVVIVATGAKWRELGIPGEKEYIGRGVAFCPHCDGPFYKGKQVAVVGGGNSGIEAAIDLAGICAHVTVVEFMDRLKADDVLVKNMRALPNVEVITSARTTEVVGDGAKVTALKYQERVSEEVREIVLDGVFVQIGLVPNSAIVKDILDVNRFGEIVIDAKNRTSAPGVYAAGDVTTVPFKQIVIAMGEGAKAALSAFADRIRTA